MCQVKAECETNVSENSSVPIISSNEESYQIIKIIKPFLRETALKYKRGLHFSVGRIKLRAFVNTVMIIFPYKTCCLSPAE